MKKETAIKILVSTLLTFILVYLLIREIRIEDIFAVMSSIPIKILGFAFLAYISSYIFRVLRFRVMMREISFREMFRIICLHNMFNGLLPFRTGELSFIYLASKKERKDKTVSSLLVARFFDFIVIFVVFISVILLSGSRERSLIISSGLFILAIALSFIGFFASVPLLRYMRKAASEYPLIIRIISFAERVIDNLKEISKEKKSLWISLFSIGVWASNYVFIYLLVSAMGISLPIYSITIAITLTILINILPIHGLVSFGTMETGWVLSFMLFGVGKDLAISSAFAYHIIHICCFMIMGFIGLLAYAPALSRKD